MNNEPNNLLLSTDFADYGDFLKYLQCDAPLEAMRQYLRDTATMSATMYVGRPTKDVPKTDRGAIQKAFHQLCPCREGKVAPAWRGCTKNN